MIEILQRPAASSEAPSPDEALDPRVLSSVLVSVKLAQSQGTADNFGDPQARLFELTHSPPMRALLDAAVSFAQQAGVAPHEGLQQIVMNLQEIDRLWTQVLLNEGLARLSSQYH